MLIANKSEATVLRYRYVAYVMQHRNLVLYFPLQSVINNDAFLRASLVRLVTILGMLQRCDREQSLAIRSDRDIVQEQAFE